MHPLSNIHQTHLSITTNATAGPITKPTSLITFRYPFCHSFITYWFSIFSRTWSFALSSANSAIYDTLCRRLVGICNAVIMSLNYRRASENPYPCAYDDGWAALKWLNSKPWLRSEDGLSPRLNLSSSSFHPSEVL
ncbi:hypothetical protein VitviT2T_028273 [Vitis vinifera]|uniref:Alpha/beta hydrolase fold-3 domain-containing protein n=2 Tax=Vitis vinifera TaxID=29760 RepID=D7U6W4_VITVI